MFEFHIAFALGLLALASGTILYVWSQRNQGMGTGLAKIIGALIIVLSIPSLLCTSFWGFKSWQDSYFEHPMASMQGLPQPMMMPMMDHHMNGHPKEQLKDSNSMDQR